MSLFSILAQNDSILLHKLNIEVESLQNLIGTSNSVICNEITAANTLLEVISIIVAIVIFGIGLYVNYLHTKLKRISKDVKDKEEAVIKISESLKNTEIQINSNIQSLYERFRKEELKAYVKRLETEPSDVTNLSSILLSTTLDDENYPVLVNAYRKLKESGHYNDSAGFGEFRKGNSYRLLFFQHFLNFAMLEEDLAEEMVDFFKTGCECAFERDAIKSTTDLCMAINDPRFKLNKTEVLYKYLSAINVSKFKTLKELKIILEGGLKEKNLLRKAIDRCTQDEVYLQLFGVTAPLEDDKPQE